MASHQELPHDYISERALIGSLIVDQGAFDEIVEIGLDPTDFYHPTHQVIYQAIYNQVTQGLPFDLVSLSSKLRDMGKLEVIGGQTKLIELTDEVVTTANVHHYAKLIQNKSVLRRIVKTSMKVTEQGLNFQGDLGEFIDDVEASFFKLTGETKEGKLFSIKDALKENLKAFEKGKQADGEITGVSTGFHKLDEKLLGMQPGQMIIVAARPGMGKTALALNIAVNACKQAELPVLIFSYEMLGPELSGRILSSEANVDSRKIRTNDYNDVDLRSIGHTVGELSRLPIFINDSGSTTVLDIKSQARKIKMEQGIGLIVIDYLQLMRPHVRKQSREQEIAEISRSIKELAKELGCPIMALSQLNRSAAARPDKRPQLQDLRESGSIEQDADVVILIHREDYYDENTPDKGVAEIIVAKNRAGQPGTVKLAWNPSQTKFATLQYESSDDD